MLWVRLLGELAAEADGKRLELPPGRRSRALLGWLALHPGRHARRELAERFWPDVLEASARASLRSALWSLRAVLGSDRLPATRERVGLVDGVSTDVAEFRAAARGGDLARAVALCDGGELLAGLDDDWVLEARTEHRRELDAVLGRLVTAALQAGDPAAAAGWARRRAVLDPLSEDAARDVMRALAEAGDRPAALAAYAALRRRLRLELGLSPSAETRAVRDRIRAEGDPVRDLAAGADPLVGRRRELAALVHAWRAAASGRGGVVLVGGEAGIGKTRLAQELAGRAVAAGGRVAACAALDLGAAAPFGLWAELLRDLTEGLPDPPAGAAWAGELSRLSPGLARRLGGAPAGLGGSPELERARLFEAVVDLVELAGDDRPLLLVFDDAHAADRSSLELLGYLGRRARRLPLLLLLTRRELPRRPELDALLVRLRAHGAVADELALGPLSPTALASLVRGVGDAERARVVERADGNPLLAIELARATARGDPHLPASLHDAARAMLASLPDEARTLAELLAVAGRELDRGALERLPLEDWIAGAGHALDSGLLVSADGRLGYRHGLLRDAVYADVGEPRRGSLHGHVAAALAGSGRAAAVAHHLRRAGRDADAVRHLARAAADARRVAALDDAAAFLGEALAGAPADTGLLLELGETEAWRGRTEAARTAFDQALASLPAHEVPAQARAWLRRGRAFRGALCLPRESHAAYRAALALLDPHADERPEALAGLAWAEAVAGDVQRVDPLLGELAASVGSEPADHRLALDVGLARGHALIRRGRFAESHAPLLAAAEAGRAAGRPDLAYTCWINASSAAACAGDFERALALADRCRLAARQAGLLPLEANALSARTHILVRLERCDEAVSAAAEARDIAERLDSAPLRATAAHDAGMAHRAAGDYARAAELLAQGLTGGAGVSRPLARLARAEALARLGRLAEAEAELDETALEPVRAGDFPATLVARLAFVQALIAAARGDVVRARRGFEESVDGWRRAAGAPLPGDEYMRIMVDLGRPPVAGLVEPAREQARAEAELAALRPAVSA